MSTITTNVKPAVSTELIKNFRGSVNVVNLLGELSMKATGKFYRDRGIERATRLMSLLEESTNKAIQEDRIVKTKRVGDRQYTRIDNEADRQTLATHYWDSQEAVHLCSVTDLVIQQQVLETLKEKMKSSPLFYKAKYKDSRIKHLAKKRKFVGAKSRKELAPKPTTTPKPKYIEASKHDAYCLLAADKDAVGNSKVVDGDWIIPTDSGLVRIKQELYFEASEFINGLSGDAFGNLRREGMDRCKDTSTEPLDLPSTFILQDTGWF